MSRDELSRLVGDVMGNPTMLSEAMDIKNQAALEKFINNKGYKLTKDEMLEVWSMASKVMAGHTHPIEEAEARIAHARGTA